MTTILDAVKVNPNERPKYSRYQLAEMVKSERISKRLTIDEVANQFNVGNDFWQSIEQASRVFNVKIYGIIASFLNLPVNEILAKEKDNLDLMSFRAVDDENLEILEAVNFANIIFNELVVQEKIGV